MNPGMVSCFMKQCIKEIVKHDKNALLSPLDDDTPTILQVSASAYSAFRYMLDNPNKGFLFPEEVDDEQILKYAKPHLKGYESFECSKLERPLFNKK